MEISAFVTTQSFLWGGSTSPTVQPVPDSFSRLHRKRKTEAGLGEKTASAHETLRSPISELKSPSQDVPEAETSMT